MPRISEMPRPAPLTGLELIPALQGGGPGGNAGVPLLLTGAPFGGAVLVLRAPMTADLSSTTDADPGAGAIRWNHTDPAQATALFISDDDGEAGDLSALIAALAEGGFVYVQGGEDSAARNNLQKWQVTSITADAGYTKVGVLLQASGGGFTDEDALELTVQQPLPAPGVDRNVVTSVASASGTITLDASLGDYFTTTLSDDTELVVANAPPACTLHLVITQGGTPHTVTWPATWNWGAATTPPEVPENAGAMLDVIITTSDSGASFIATARVRA